MSDFALRLKEAMEKEGISAAELSRRSGIGKNLISYYLKGKVLAGQDKTFLLAKALNVNPGWLFTGVEQKTEPQRTRVVPESEIFKKLIFGMTSMDYKIFMEILERTERNMRENGEL